MGQLALAAKITHVPSMYCNYSGTPPRPWPGVFQAPTVWRARTCSGTKDGAVCLVSQAFMTSCR